MHYAFESSRKSNVNFFRAETGDLERSILHAPSDAMTSDVGSIFMKYASVSPF